jgi:hypothetical protein
MGGTSSVFGGNRKDLGIDGRIIFKRIIQYNGGILARFFWLRIGPRGELL